MLGSSRVAAQLAPSQEGLGSMSEWVRAHRCITSLFPLKSVLAFYSRLSWQYPVDSVVPKSRITLTSGGNQEKNFPCILNKPWLYNLFLYQYKGHMECLRTIRGSICSVWKYRRLKRGTGCSPAWSMNWVMFEHLPLYCTVSFSSDSLTEAKKYDVVVSIVSVYSVLLFCPISFLI
jgi:hypothetical protein